MRGQYVLPTVRSSPLVATHSLHTLCTRMNRSALANPRSTFHVLDAIYAQMMVSNQIAPAEPMAKR